MEVSNHMELRQLRYFSAVVEEGTVTGAARRLNMTQPPLTAQLHALEEELGCTLFRREGRRLRLTDAGQTFYQRACTILGMCNATAAEMEHFQEGTAGTLRIGIVSSVQGTLFLEWITEFSSAHPQIRYELYSGNTYQLLEQLRTSQLDLAIVRTPFSAPDMVIHPLRMESILAVGISPWFQDAPPDGKISIRFLAGKPLIVYRRWEEILQSRFEAAGYTPNIRCSNDDAQTTLALAKKGLGIGILPASAIISDNCTLLSAYPIDDKTLATEIDVICRSTDQLSQSARLFRDMLIEKTL